MNLEVAPPESAPAPRRHHLMARLTNYFVTGLVIVAPLAITFYISWWFVQWIDGFVKPFIPSHYNPEYYLPFSVPGIGLLFALIFITLLGFLTANFVGRRLVAFGEDVLGRMPLVRNIYGGLKQIFETILSKRADSFRQVVLIEYPRRDVWSIAFVAAGAKGEIRDKLAARYGAGDDIVSVFMPTTPNPTTGFLLYVRSSEVIVLDMTMEEAAKLVISAGLVTPEDRQQKLARIAALAARRKPRTAEHVG
jgi:uncharacterized membrane protein